MRSVGCLCLWISANFIQASDAGQRAAGFGTFSDDFRLFISCSATILHLKQECLLCTVLC